MQLIPALRKRRLRLGDRLVAEGEPTYVIAEIGINHNGSLQLAERLIEGAAAAGCDCVKFQKRTPEICVPPDQRDVPRETPWGRTTYLEYRRRVEFGSVEYEAIDRCCRRLGIAWTASCWDEPSVDFIDRFDVPFYKAASACLTDHGLLRRMRSTGRPLMISTGMSTLYEIRAAVRAVGHDRLLIAHSTSTYPCPPAELNLRMITTLHRIFPGVPIGYSGHEVELESTSAAVALGAMFVERHVTLDPTMWGSDQAASLDLDRTAELVRRLRLVERSLGNGVKQVYASEAGPRSRLRRVLPPPAPDLRLAVFR
ncbi:MAG TPA: N-acetylneuraminate synthase family protein [Gemmatimonadales bacterium]|nr:N-acetylneuraminate synthase family protein [Gemmatimonadales bacterium]